MDQWLFHNFGKILSNVLWGRIVILLQRKSIDNGPYVTLYLRINLFRPLCIVQSIKKMNI